MMIRNDVRVGAAVAGARGVLGLDNRRRSLRGTTAQSGGGDQPYAVAQAFRETTGKVRVAPDHQSGRKRGGGAGTGTVSEAQAALEHQHVGLTSGSCHHRVSVRAGTRATTRAAVSAAHFATQEGAPGHRVIPEAFSIGRLGRTGIALSIVC